MNWPSEMPYGSVGWLYDVIRSLRACENDGDIEELALALEYQLMRTT